MGSYSEFDTSYKTYDLPIYPSEPYTPQYPVFVTIPSYQETPPMFYTPPEPPKEARRSRSRSRSPRRRHDRDRRDHSYDRRDSRSEHRRRDEKSQRYYDRDERRKK